MRIELRPARSLAGRYCAGVEAWTVYAWTLGEFKEARSNFQAGASLATPAQRQFEVSEESSRALGFRSAGVTFALALFSEVFFLGLWSAILSPFMQ